MSRIAVVEDDEDVAYLIQMLLERDGHEVLVFTDVHAARADASVWEDVNLAVIDYYLGKGETGADVVKWIRQATGFSGKIMVVTGIPRRWWECVEEDPSVEVDMVLGKVFDPDDFLLAISRLNGG